MKQRLMRIMRRHIMSFATVVIALLAIILGHALNTSSGHAQTQSNTSVSADFPRFYSLKSNPVNLRKGPGLKYPKSWVFRRQGLPVEVLREHERWRQVRDSEGATGWILRTLISRRRTALVSPWLLKETLRGAAPELTALRRRPRSRTAIAMLEPGTLVGIKKCDARWCYVSIESFRGYIEQSKLWGVYPKEVLK